MAQAYNLILNRFYSVSMPLVASSVHPFPDSETGLTKYLELKLNAQFVDVNCINKNFSLPSTFSLQRSMDAEELKEIFPLENFRFEGIVVVDVMDVTTDRVIEEIKNTLLNINDFSDVAVYADLQSHVQSLIGVKDILVGITPFYKLKDFHLYAETYYKNSFIFKSKSAQNNYDKLRKTAQLMFKINNQPLLFPSVENKNYGQNELLKYYTELHAGSLILCPLKNDTGEFIGLLEIVSQKPDVLKFEHLTKVQKAIQLFSLALERTNENLELQIDKIIKENFTAIQPAVEWKFTEAAFNFLQNRELHEAAKMPAIVFDNVFPLYGSIDVRNSSTERNKAIQLDLLEQLEKARTVLVKASKTMHFPLLKEIMYKIEKFISSTSDTLLSEEEMLIYEFLQNDLNLLFQHLQEEKPEMEKLIEDYYTALDPERNIVYHHRKEFEDSITRINDVLDRFIDQEQKVAQTVYPHYFERYITDGIEFNIYIGESLAPQRQFDEIYVKNLKLWQLTTLAKAARITHALEKRLNLPLQTTQLILAHTFPLSISFKRKERKFDVEGAYNIRYEIIKKRIDKVHVKNSEERLTQPGKIAIVYSQQKELSEYLEYIEFLQHESLLTEQVEHLELEDTQGFIGLKAVRVGVNIQVETQQPAHVELSKLTSKELGIGN